MNFFDILSLIGGLSLFLYGMHIMGQMLEKRAGGKFRSVLEKLTSNPLRGLLLGMGITALIQSSSATTVMVVGFVNAGIMQLRQAIGIIMGANIGTTVTAWILSLTALSGESFIVQLLKPSSLCSILALVGLLLLMVSKKGKHKDLGVIFLGLGVLLFGMNVMSSAVKPLANDPNFVKLFTLFKNPILGVLLGAVVTGIIQSSSASVGILQALSVTGVISYGMAIPIIMGQNIGTCVTAMLSSIGTNRNARRAALVHLYFNLIGTVVCMILFYSLNALIDFAFVDAPINAAGIAVCHTAFNVFCTVLLFPFSKQLERLTYLTVPEKGESEMFQKLDKRFFLTPPVAVSISRQTVHEMAQVSLSSIQHALNLRKGYDPKLVETVIEEEKKLDQYEDKLTDYLVELSGYDLGDENAHKVAEYLYVINDFERIGDHALNICHSMTEVMEKEIVFTAIAQSQLDVIESAVREIVQLTTEAFIENNVEKARLVEPLEEVIDELRDAIKDGHVQRLQHGECGIIAGFVLTDILSNLERVSDHCSNIAASVVQNAHKSLAVHEYTGGLKAGDPDFLASFQEYKKKYTLD